MHYYYDILIVGEVSCYYPHSLYAHCAQLRQTVFVLRDYYNFFFPRRRRRRLQNKCCFDVFRAEIDYLYIRY